MKLKKLFSNTNGTRHQLVLTKNLLIKYNSLIKSQAKGIKNQSGRSSLNGRISISHKGGGLKNLYRKINFSDMSVYSIVLGVQYDPNRSSFISINFNFIKKNFFYNLCTEKVFCGSLFICSSNQSDFKLGFRCLLKNIPTGSIVHSLTLGSDSNTKLIRSAGTFGQLLQKDSNFCKIRLPSGLIVTCPTSHFATIGKISNVFNSKVVLGKAGKNRKKGIRPSVRGVAMNPVDHPHGGRTNGGRPSVTPWGLPTKNYPTVRK
jgi:large subunit ribosomal protein L2